MNSMIIRSGLVAAALCAVLLVGCDSVKNVKDQSFTAIPTPQEVLSGRVTGLGTARAVSLSYNGAPDCFAADPTNPAAFLPAPCKFYGTQGQSESGFTFGSFNVGTPYTVTVQNQPFGKICTVANASGTVGDTSAAPVVTCANDPAVARYDLTVNVASALQTLPDLKVTLTSEDGVQVQDATGQASVQFPGVLFNSQTSLPGFEYKVTATTDTTAGTTTTSNLCTFTPTAGFSVGGQNRNSTDTVVVPTGDASVTVNACSFTVSATVQYNGTPTQPMGTDGLTLALRNHFTGVDEQTLDVNAFTAGPATVSFPAPVLANANAIYELRVTKQPVGQTCVVYGTTTTYADTTSATPGVNNAIAAPTAGAVLLVDPANSDWWAYASRSVRCRATPAAPDVLVGTYQMDARVPDDTYPNPGRGREFLTFFDDGTFMYGINFNAASLTAGFPNATFPVATPPLRLNAFASSGVTHGFYAYNSVAGTIAFTVFTATNINAQSRGITGMPGYSAFTGGVTAASVAKGTDTAGLGTLSMTFASGPDSRLWTMTEPRQISGEITGTWVTADHLRSFIYDKDLTFAFHMGVNGMGNLQDVCMLPTDNSTQSAGLISKHAGSAADSSYNYTCTPGAANLPVSQFAQYNTRSVDLPHYAAKNGTPSLVSGLTTPRIAPGFHGRFPGTASQLDNRPTSPTQFEVAAGNPDTLTVQKTLNGVPVDQPITFMRIRTQ